MTSTSSLNQSPGMHLIRWHELVFNCFRDLRDLGFLEVSLAVKTKVKKALSTSAFYFITWKRKFVVFKHHPDLKSQCVSDNRDQVLQCRSSQISVCEKIHPYFMPLQLQNSFMLRRTNSKKGLCQKIWLGCAYKMIAPSLFSDLNTFFFFLKGVYPLKV